MLSKLIKTVSNYKGYTRTKLAEKMNTSRQNLSKKLEKDNLREEDMLQMAAALGCDLKIAFVDKETGKEYIYAFNDKEIIVTEIRD